MSKSPATATPKTNKAAATIQPPVPDVQRSPEKEADLSSTVGQRAVNAVGGGSPQAPPQRFGALLGQLGGTAQRGMLRQLQRSYGNSYVGSVIQAKMTVGQPGDIYEEEADRVADTVMRMPEPDTATGASVTSHIQPLRIQRMCTECREEEEEKIHPKESPGQTPTVTPALEARLNATRGSGQPLPKATRTFMESRFGQDFSPVRVHAGGDAVQLNQELRVQAFTHRQDMYFGARKYSPETREGQRLLAHELTHVVQQHSGLPKPYIQLQAMSRDWSQESTRLTMRELEREIERMRSEVLKPAENSEDYENQKEGLSIFEQSLVERQENLIRYREEIGEMRGQQREVLEKAEGDPFSNLLQSLQMKGTAEALFTSGFVVGYYAEIPPSALQDFVMEMKDHWLDFYKGYATGIPVGLWNGLTGLLEGIWMLIEFGILVSSGPAGIIQEIAKDPSAFIKLCKLLNSIAEALEEFGEQVIEEPTVVLELSGELGLALGQEVGDWFTGEILKQSLYDKGYLVGDIVGQILFEILLEIILLLLTRGIGNLLRGFAAVGQGARAARASGRVANIIRRMLEASPAFRRLFQRLTGLEDITKATPRTASPPVQSPTSLTSSGGSKRPLIRGATSEGVGSEFTYEYLPEALVPEVIKPKTSTTPEPVAVPFSRTTPVPLKSNDIVEILSEATENTAFGRSPSDTDIIDIPNPRQVEEIVANTSATRLTTRQIWEPPPGATPRPLPSAPREERLQWLRDRLRIHVDRAIERFEIEGPTPEQLYDVPRYAAHRGSRIDQFAKDSILQDPDLAEVITAPDFVKSPDILDSVIPDWFDITTKKSWVEHLRRYQERYGQLAELLETRKSR